MDWSALLLGILSSLIAAVVLGIVVSNRGWIVFQWRAGARTRAWQKRMLRAGVSNFYATRDDYTRYRGAPTILEYLQLADRSVHVAAHWTAHGTEMEGLAKGIANLVKNPKGISVTVAIIDPTSSEMESLARYLDLSPSEVKSRVQSSLSKLYEARGELSEEQKERFRLKVHNAISVGSLILLDGNTENGRVQLDLKAYKVPRQRSIGLEFTGGGALLYELWKDATLNIIQDGINFDPEVHLFDFPSPR